MEIDQLIQGCLKKDESAQMEVYNRYHLSMYHSALRIVKNRVDAEDVMHESFLTAFEKLAQYKGGNKFGGWLKQITLRKALHCCEKRNKLKTSPLEDGRFYEPEINASTESTVEKFNLNSAGSDKIDLNIEATSVTARLAGSGKIILKGNATNINAKHAGSGSIRLQGHQAKNGKVSLAGSGNVYVSSSQNLEASVEGSGSVRYFGEPKNKLHNKVDGSGSVRLAK